MLWFSTKLLSGRQFTRNQNSVPLPHGIGGCRFSPRVERALIDAADHIGRVCDRRLGPLWLSLPVMRLLGVSPAPGVPGLRLPRWSDTTCDVDNTDDGTDILFNTACTTHPSLFHAKCAAMLCVPLSPRRQILFPSHLFEALRSELKRRRKGAGAVSPFWFPVDFLAAMEKEGQVECSVNIGAVPVTIGATSSDCGQPALQFVNCFDISRGLEISEILMRSKDPEIIFGAGGTTSRSLTSDVAVRPDDGEGVLSPPEMFVREETTAQTFPIVAFNPLNTEARDRLLALPNHRSSDALTTRDFFRLKVIRFQRNLRSEFWCEDSALHTIVRNDRVDLADSTQEACSHSRELADKEDCAFRDKLLQRLQPFGVNVHVRCCLLPGAAGDPSHSSDGEAKMIRLFNLQDVQNQRSILLHGKGEVANDATPRFSRRSLQSTTTPPHEDKGAAPKAAASTVRLTIELDKEQVLSLSPLVLTTKDKSVRVHMEEFGAKLVEEAPK